ncbi:sterol-binding protein [Methylomonas koyamae]|uniref:Ubiquinone biosynthesis accessory factor UbiJ n=2 Tax=Methylomonas koyamae TaxID=702114 RepID=A0A177NCT3_9GAMM|nr:SCP2 sterol-binding domain-containing protein [Methylomonas koyamae]OAI14850.1 sterol-binding protein [Methylomonas koyamae]
MPSALKPLLISALEAALARYLALDSHSAEYLAPMAGKVIELRIDTFGSSLFLCPGSDSIRILDSYPEPADATLSGSLSALGLMGLSATPMRSLFKGEVRLAGDVQLARKFQRLFEKLDIDLQGKLARVAGDRMAHRLGDIVRGGKRWTGQSLRTFRLNLEEFLQEETRELPAKAEAELLFRAIDDCRSDCDRLAARLDRLAAAANNLSESD